MTTQIISVKKEIVDVVKNTLQPIFDEFGLSHDDFKNIAKTATSKIPASGKTMTEIQLVVFETILEQNPPSLSRAGFSSVHQQIEKIQTEISAGRINNTGNFDNNNNDDDDALGNRDFSDSTSATSKFQVSGDERITLASFKNFMVGARKIAKQQDHEAGQRRQRF